MTPGDTGITAEVNYLDWAEITYPRRLIAEGDRLDFISPGGDVELDGFTGPVSIYDISDPQSARQIEDIAAVNNNGSFSVRLTSRPGRRYLAIGPAGFLTARPD